MTAGEVFQCTATLSACQCYYRESSARPSGRRFEKGRINYKGNLPDSPCNSRSPCGCRCRRMPECASACPARPPRRRHLCCWPSWYPPYNNRWYNTSSDHFGQGNPRQCRRTRVHWRTWNPRYIPHEIGDAPRIPAWTGAGGKWGAHPATEICCVL